MVWFRTKTINWPMWGRIDFWTYLQLLSRTTYLNRFTLRSQVNGLLISRSSRWTTVHRFCLVGSLEIHQEWMSASPSWFLCSTSRKTRFTLTNWSKSSSRSLRRYNWLAMIKYDRAIRMTCDFLLRFTSWTLSSRGSTSDRPLTAT
jgi:hypothetical protein